MATEIQELQDRVAALEVALGRRARAQAQAGAEFLPISQAAAQYGLTTEGLRCRIRRENRRPGGLEIRRSRGMVHMGDLRKFFEAGVKRSPRAQARAALANLRREGKLQ